MTTSEQWWEFFNVLNSAPAYLLPTNVNRAVLGKLFAHADGPGAKGVPLSNARPGTPLIARDLGIGESSVWRALAWLRAEGWIVQTTPGGRKGARKVASTYRLQIPPAVREALAAQDEQQQAVAQNAPAAPHPSQIRESTPLKSESHPSQDWDPTYALPTPVPTQPSYKSRAAARDDAGAKEAQDNGTPVHRSAAFKASPDRIALLSAVQAVARAKGAGEHQEANDRWCDFWEIMERVFAVTDHDLREYTPPGRAYADRLAAGTWLMKLLNTANKHVGPLEWTPTPEDPAAHATYEAERRRQLDALTARQGTASTPHEPPQEADAPEDHSGTASAPTDQQNPLDRLPTVWATP